MIALLLSSLLSLSYDRAAESARQPEAAPIAGEYAEPARMASEAMEALKADGVPGFCGVAFSGRKGSLRQSDRVACESLFDKLHAAAVAQQGKPLGDVERVRMEVVGRSLVRFIFVEKLERGVVVWFLNFYRAGDEWAWTGFNLNDKPPPAGFRAAGSNYHFRPAYRMAHEGFEAIDSCDLKRLLDLAFDADHSVFNADRNRAELNLLASVQRATANIGKPVGVELIRTETFGDSLVRFVYLQKFETGACVWKFSFYRNGSGWKWQDIYWGEWGSEFIEK